MTERITWPCAAASGATSTRFSPSTKRWIASRLRPSLPSRNASTCSIRPAWPSASDCDSRTTSRSWVRDIGWEASPAAGVAVAFALLVAPPLNFGFSHYFLEYTGTLSLRVSTLLPARNR